MFLYIMGSGGQWGILYGHIIHCFEYMYGKGKAGMEVSIDYRFIVCMANLFSCILR